MAIYRHPDRSEARGMSFLLLIGSGAIVAATASVPTRHKPASNAPGGGLFTPWRLLAVASSGRAHLKRGCPLLTLPLVVRDMAAIEGTTGGFLFA